MSVQIKRDTDGNFEIFIRNEYPPVQPVVEFAVSAMGYLIPRGESMSLNDFARNIILDGIAKGRQGVAEPIALMLNSIQAKDDPKVELMQMFDDLGNDDKLLNAGREAFSDVNKKRKIH